ncbi:MULTISPECIES: CD225/dispanin family protein [unclassified Lysobacter]|uniref:CD225/dispanin family protein n=1 Tax=unclassified Lysobacter TaxID=2635362 RepID=UPI001C250A03|nr:CD225/dispanin family protein [Lysobacter sp. MMG2]MBU8977664.1 CD225/dispanin family protein [Lysobacter sp. MMG2]
MNVPPPVPPSPSLAPRVPNYLIWAILITIASVLFCCIIGTIPGIVAIVFAAQVNSKLAAGDEAGAWVASGRAKLWCWITTGLTILGLCWTIYFFTSGGMSQYQQMLQELEQAQRVQS